jgi:hypothetical protein
VREMRCHATTLASSTDRLSRPRANPDRRASRSCGTAYRPDSDLTMDT